MFLDDMIETHILPGGYSAPGWRIIQKYGEGVTVAPPYSTEDVVILQKVFCGHLELE